MSDYVIGIDPGATKGHGVATYEDGVLIDLSMMNLMQLMEHLNHLGNVPVVHIEDLMSQKGNWHTKNQGQQASAKTGEHLGYCKWAQVEVERLCEYLGIKVVKHRVSRQWKCTKVGRPIFEKATGWTGNSNEDKRSAAYFGFIGCKSN